MKRFLFLFTILLSLSLGVTAWATPQEGSLALLAELEIMQGDPDGNLRLDDPVTRAEFTKMAVASSAYRNSVAKSLSISPFPDVTYRHWAAPYVRVGVTNGLVSGYPDATFRPDDGVLFEEAVTIMLRVLGYTDSDFGVSWPYGQLGLAGNLDMTDYLDCSAGEVMNRGQVAQLIYNTLRVDMKGKSTQLVNDFGIQIQEDVTLIADSNDDASIAANEVFTSVGTYKTDTAIDRSLLGLTGDTAIKNGNKLIAFMPTSGNNATEDYVVYSSLSDLVMVYRNNTLQSLDIDDSTTVYKGKSQITFGNLKNSLSMGDVLRVKKSGISIDYITWQRGSLLGPLTVRSANWGDSWGIDATTSVMRNGVVSSVSSLQTYDVAYYLKDLNLALAYSDKVTGVYEKASPNKDMPSSITVSGKDYPIEGSAAFSKLASGGDFLLGDTITLLLGKDGGIADVVSATAMTGGKIAGYVLDTGRKTFSSGNTATYTGYYVKLVLPNGETMEYTTAKDYSSFQNKVVTVTVKDGSAQLSLAPSGNKKLSGTFSWETRKLGSYTIASDAEILDIGTQDTYKASVYARIFPQRLDGVRLTSDQVLYYAQDNSGAISKMILNNVTNDGFSFGVATYAKNDNSTLSGSYEYMVDGQFYSLSTSSRVLYISSGSGIMLGGNFSNPDFISKLTELPEKVTDITYSHIITKTRSYPISSKVSVYRKHFSFSNEYTQIPLSDIIGEENLNFSAYYDSLPSAGGQIRVIVVY